MASNDDIIIEQPKSTALEIISKSDSPQLLDKKPKIKNTNGLDLLNSYEKLMVKQEMDVLGSMCSCCDKLNKYKIKDTDGKTVLTAIEEDSCCNISCCRAGRKFEMKLLDPNGDELIHLTIPSECSCCQCCYCCKYKKLEVFSPPDNQIGTIQESWNCFHKQLKVYTGSDSQPKYNIDGPTCQISSCCCSDVEFTIVNYENGEECGAIKKKWSGLAKEALTYMDNFGVKFPSNAHSKEKALLLGACIMIDLMYFEKKKSDKDDDSD